MKCLLLFVTLFLSVPSFGINYYRCDKTADCAKAYGGCGRYFSVHGRYKELFEAKARVGDRVSFCLKPRDIDNKYKFEGEPFCKKNRCLLILSKNKKDSQVQ